MTDDREVKGYAKGSDFAGVKVGGVIVRPGAGVTLKSEGIYISQEEHERIMEELLQESRVYREDNMDGSLDDYVVVNNVADEEGTDGITDDPWNDDLWEEVPEAVRPAWIEVPSLQFFMPMRKVPTGTAQEKGYRVIPNGYSHVNGVKKPRFRVVTFDKPSAAEARAELKSALETGLRKWMRKNGYEGILNEKEPIFGRGVPVSLTVKWCFGSKDVETGKIPDGFPKVTKPDTDNLNKALKDCMTELGFWYDDAQVTEEHTGKYWTGTPGIFIRAERITHEEE